MAAWRVGFGLQVTCIMNTCMSSMSRQRHDTRAALAGRPDDGDAQRAGRDERACVRQPTKHPDGVGQQGGLLRLPSLAPCG